ncbi:aspartyl-phosphate phosphatase Spo0E family protein [Lysinibacillus yapensis]|uniref:Aspartyl-phosphate phosphatase Spo0E family protein n=1 Tax=Ureibacillus yapensis TaxID=2304605 RepID=A0A396SDP8_9BACL|nr:aspartyl-phosphate phosphatase Spo0E family protein [Lysinibacillus yapensis]RHW39823.1 aspartyl-phosphate phosphatase Spo0E family protein [Lysinibacillus yapensis]
MVRDLLNELEKKRQLMIKSGVEYGLQNPKTIRLSKELDRLMNEYDIEDISNKLHRAGQLKKNAQYDFIQ